MAYCEYDVFLSFRGEDTRRSFTSHLYEALQLKGIHTFMDDVGFERGEEISQSLINSIERSRNFLVIFSENYASSTWCLNELVKIMECVKEKNRLIIPVFYGVDPSDVRHLRGGYAHAFDKHMENFKYRPANVLEWAKALQRAANIPGLNFNPRCGSVSELIGKIAEIIFSKASRFPLHVADYPVGLAARSLKLQSLMDVESAGKVKVIGIWGMGGIGKTTLAKAVFNETAGQFEGSSFLHHVRENSSKCGGLAQLRDRLLFDLLEDKTVELDNVKKGNSSLLTRLSGKRVLLVLDDVHHPEPLQALAGGYSWFGRGSRIIITTRDKHLLDFHGVGTQFEVKPLNDKEALELFSWNAFRTNAVDPSYLDASHRVLLYAKGLPLALEVIGSVLYGNKTRTLAKFERVPASATFHEILRVIYDDLDHVQKTVFLDIACFFEGQRLEYVSNLLQSTCGFSFDNVIRGLVDKSLVRIECGVLCMHDLLRDLAREIVRQQSRSRPFKVLRPAWKDVSRALQDDNMATDIDVISLKYLKKIRSNGVLHLMHYPSYFPSDINPGRGAVFHMFKSLGHLDFKSCALLRELPDLSGVPNLSELRLQDCKNLTKIHHSIGYLGLRSLCLQGCSNLKAPPHAMKLKSLDLSGCTSPQTHPKISQKMANLREANFVGTILQELLKSSCDFEIFSMCKGRQGSPKVSSSVTHLDLSGCNLSDMVFVYLVFFPNLQNLNLGANNLTILPANIKECSHLTYLSLDNCKKLRKIEGVPPNIELFRATNCTSLNPISSAMLLSQPLHKAGNTQFILPGSRIPHWFDHFNRGGSVTFWACNKFPHIALCFVLRRSDMRLTKFKLKLRMVINGKHQFDFDYNYFLTLVVDHIMMFDLRSQMTNNELEETLLDNEWNHVQVSCVDALSLEGILVEKEIVRCIGVYVYRQLCSVRDIQFANPNFGRRTDNLSCCSGDLEPHCNTLLKRQREFLEMGAFHTPNMNRQINLGSVAQNVPKRFKTVFEDRGKYSAVYSNTGMESDIEWLSLLPSLQPLKGANMILNPVVSKTTSDLSNEKGAYPVEPNDNLIPMEHCTDYAGSSLNDIAVKETYASNEKGVKLMNKFCKICRRIHSWKSKLTSMHQSKPVAEACFQSTQTQMEKICAHIPDSSGNLGSLSEEADDNLISMEHCTDHVDSGLNEIALKAIYASIESEATDLSLLMVTETNNESVNTKLSDEAMKALQILRDYLTKKFSSLLDPGRSKILKTILDYLLSLSEDDGISVRMRSVILRLSKSFTMWTKHYDAASVRLKSTTADLLKLDKLQVDIEANVKELKEVDSLEDEMGRKLASLQERKRHLEEHIQAITKEIMELRFPGGTFYN